MAMNVNQAVMRRQGRLPRDLEERTLIFARDVARLCRKTFKDVVSVQMIDPLIRAAGSVGAQYRKANESPTEEDFIARTRAARKECRESAYWLELLKMIEPVNTLEINALVRESQELKALFTAIIQRSM